MSLLLPACSRAVWFAPFDAVHAKMVGMLLGPFHHLYATFQARRLVPGATPCICRAEKLPAMPARLPANVRSLQGASCYRTTLMEEDCPNGTKPAVEIIWVVREGVQGDNEQALPQYNRMR